MINKILAEKIYRTSLKMNIRIDLKILDKNLKKKKKILINIINILSV